MYVDLDLEANGLDLEDVTRVWCVAISIDGQEPKLFVEDSLDALRQVLDYYEHRGYTFVAHNGIDYDFPVLRKIIGWYPSKILDTLVMSRVCYPTLADIPKPHSVKAWGKRFGDEKIDFEGPWDTYTEEMGTYCQQDVRVLTKIREEVMKATNFKPEVVAMEQQVQQIITEQRHNGFWFDMDKAQVLVEELQKAAVAIQDEVNKVFPPVVEELNTPEYWETPNCIQYPTKKAAQEAGFKPKDIKRGPPKTRTTPFNPNSDQQIAQALMERDGWEPEEFTPTGLPKISLDLLESMDSVSSDLFYRYKVIEKRLSQIISGDGSWFHFFNRRTHCIHGWINAQGTRTTRMSHSSPNMSAVPTNDKPYGTQCRSLFAAKPGLVLVGADASGLEARVLSHFLSYYDGGEFANIFLGDGDFHSENAEALGCSRPPAKTWFYGYLYGAGDTKLGKILGGSVKDGKKSREAFRKKFKGFGLIASDLKMMHDKGYIIGLDKRRIPSVSEHSTLNTLCQSTGSLVMKKALCILWDSLYDQGLRHRRDFGFCANSHDEWQIETKPELTDTIGQTAVNSIRQAGQFYSFNCPLDGEYKVGKNWSETH